ncbi:thioredoxin domain-containing protein [Candidatus Electronema sp. PJ]|uniref:thioredoxin domain-containing protein n=1 Tax=Candidatus Electronema sp. PJ TaxID=3401572 RepID=UPI003AA84F9C
MMKKTLTLGCFLLLFGQIASAQPPAPEQQPAAKPDALSWTVMQAWKTESKPVDFVQSLDGRIVFILGEDNKVYLYSTEGQKLGVIPADPDTVGVDISPRGEMLYLMDKSGAYKALDISFAKDIDISGSPFKGKEDAPVALVVFSDFQCPFCSKVHPLMEEVMKKNPDKVKVVFKHMPLGMHQQAEPAARAAIAAQAQGKFWEMHDALFAAATGSGLTAEAIDKAAAAIGLDVAKFKADLNSPATQEKLAKDMTTARLAEVNGTPTLFVNGRRVNSPSPDAIQKMIDQEVAKKK